MPVKPPPRPSWRKPAGIFLILALIAAWAAVVTTLVGLFPRMPLPLQLVCFVAGGIVWILPLKPLLRWMELGRWRK